MLVLTRRIGEAIRIGPDILVYVSDVRGSQTRIGVAAPREVSVLREELCQSPVMTPSDRVISER